jgi:hypothetical protein
VMKLEIVLLLNRKFSVALKLVRHVN